MHKKLALLAAGALLPSLAFAHPGHDVGFMSAFAHPFGGIDHLLMMLFVGVWAGRIGGDARWQLPLSFLAAMAVGFLLGMQGMAFAGIETGIAAGLIALGVLLAINATLPRAAQMLIVAAFAVLHGIAHGVELKGVQPLMTVAGFIAATALLHTVGVVFAQRWSRERTAFYRVCGAVLSAAGCGLLLGA